MQLKKILEELLEDSSYSFELILNNLRGTMTNVINYSSRLINIFFPSSYLSKRRGRYNCWGRPALSLRRNGDTNVPRAGELQHHLRHFHLVFNTGPGGDTDLLPVQPRPPTTPRSVLPTEGADVRQQPADGSPQPGDERLQQHTLH